MKNKLLITLMLTIMINTVYAQQIKVMLGNTPVYIDINHKGVGNNFVHLHKNETTALKAAQKTLAQCGGTLINLRHPGGRNISFTLANKRYTFDPNRMFTAYGLKKTLSSLSRYDKQAAKEVSQLADKVLQLLNNNTPIIAVHNNKNYSMKNYYPTGNMNDDAALIYKNPKRYYRNFYFVTTKKDFNKFKALGFNVVLQNNKTATDDGSLSVAKSDLDYINVEAGYDQLQQQIEMLKATCQ